jgi:histidinol-phosphate aminotransferase
LQRLSRITVYPSRANFLLIREPEDVDLFTELKQRGILVRSVSSYPFLIGHQRVSVGFKEENDLFLNELAAILERKKE